MAKEIVYRNEDHSTNISLSLDESNDLGLTINGNHGDGTFWFTDPAEIDDFIKEVQKLKDQMVHNLRGS